jgi:hypothetical protein
LHFLNWIVIIDLLNKLCLIIFYYPQNENE